MSIQNLTALFMTTILIGGLAPRLIEAQTDGVTARVEVPLENNSAVETGVHVAFESFTTLSSFESYLLQNHPTLKASFAEIQVARHQALQEGLQPNPQLGLFIDELGNENDPGLWGAYLQKKIVRGNKLGLQRAVKNREAMVLERTMEKRSVRLRTNLRLAFYKLLIVQQKLQLASQLYKAQSSVVEKSKALTESGETPATDSLQAELQAQRTLIAFRTAEVARRNAWRELVAMIGRHDLPIQTIEGSLKASGDSFTFEICLDNLLAESPEIQVAVAEVERLRVALQKECAFSIPDYQAQITLGRDSTTNHFYTGIQLQVPLQIHDRNQGNIAAAQSRLIQAQHIVEEIELGLSKRLAAEYQQYEGAKLASDMFANELLPKASETLNLLKDGYPQEVSILQLLSSQQTVIDLTSDYLDSINQLWISRLKIEGLLLHSDQ